MQHVMVGEGMRLPTLMENGLRLCRPEWRADSPRCRQCQAESPAVAAECRGIRHRIEERVMRADERRQTPPEVRQAGTTPRPASVPRTVRELEARQRWQHWNDLALERFGKPWGELSISEKVEFAEMLEGEKGGAIEKPS